MKISYQWLRELLPGNFNLPPQDLAQHLLLLGFEVAEMKSRGPGFSGVIVGEILEIQKHPNADRLSLCSVTNGREKLSIVCGAKNVAVGARVPVAQVGAVLPGGRTIERSKIRGQESQGMICSAMELGLPEKNGEGILILPANTPVGEDASKILGESDTILEVEITPNRPDCLSHYGLARELAIHFGCQLQPLSHALPTIAADPQIRSRRVEIEAPKACWRYIGREFRDLTVGPSPAWIIQRLEAVGLRSINNLVDITNYVFLELGHPLHAFDSDKLQGDVISTRLAKPGEKIAALDGKTYALSDSELVIADALVPVAIAGVIGGEPTSVTEKTKNAFLESACFKPAMIRRASKKLKLRTDSSHRFERGTDPATAAAASHRATELILQLCLGRAGEIVDTYPEKEDRPPIEITSVCVNQILGSNFAPEKIEAVLKRISPELASRSGILIFPPPPHRLDLHNANDLAEEVARHLGYDSVSSAPSPIKIQRPKSIPLVDLISRLQDRLKALGFDEAYNLDFVSAAQLDRCGLSPEKASAIAVLNPLSEDYAYLRPTLLVGLLQNALYNHSRGAKNLRLFEIGHAYAKSGNETLERTQLSGLLIGEFPAALHWRGRATATDFYDAKGIMEDLLKIYSGVTWEKPEAGLSDFFHPQVSLEIHLSGKRIGAVGQLHPKLVKVWDLGDVPAAAFEINDLETLTTQPSPSFQIAAISAFPSIERDLSVILDTEIPYSQIHEALKSLDNLSRLQLIDVYTGAGIPTGKKSFTMRLTFTHMDRTLRDEEAASAVEKASGLLADRFKAKPRT